MERLRDSVDDPAIIKAAHLALDKARYLAASQALAGADRELAPHRPAFIWRGEPYASTEAIRAALPGPDADRVLQRFAEAEAPYEALAEQLGRQGLVATRRRAGKAWRQTYRRLARVPAATPVGLLAKLRALERVFLLGIVTVDDAAFWASVVGDAERFAMCREPTVAP
jgi:hypothetical protein